MGTACSQPQNLLPRYNASSCHHGFKATEVISFSFSSISVYSTGTLPRLSYVSHWILRILAHWELVGSTHCRILMPTVWSPHQQQEHLERSRNTWSPPESEALGLGPGSVFYGTLLVILMHAHVCEPLG